MFKKKPDEIVRQFWQHQGVQLGFLVLVVALGFILPKIPALRGWEYKLTAAAVEIGKSEIPAQAVRVKTAEEAADLLSPKNPSFRDYLQLEGPLPIAAWPCSILAQPGVCVRYIWKNNDPLTLVATTAPKKAKDSLRPFNKSGWSGYILVSHQLAIAITGPADADEILEMIHH